jgi:prolipoprotein diacylglyceryltransferase
MGRAGAVVGGCIYAITAWSAGIGATAIVATVAANIASFYGWRRIEAWRRGQRRYVLVEHAAVAGALTLLIAILTRSAASPAMGAWGAGVAWTLAIGRLGCLFLGCCHGRLAPVGVRYPWLYPWQFGPPWNQVCVLPIQAIEAAWLAVLGAVGLVLTLTIPNWSFPAVAAGYAVARFEIELWRGDSRRYIGRLSMNQYECIAVAAVSAFLQPAAGITAFATIVVLGIVQRDRLRSPSWCLSNPSDLLAINDAVAVAQLEGASRVASAELRTDERGRVIVNSPAADRELETVVELVAAAQKPL